MHRLAKHIWLFLLVPALTAALSYPLNAETPPPGSDAPPKQIKIKDITDLLTNEKDLIDQRTRAEQLLKRDPKDYKAHYLLGFVLHRAEGDLARARYHLDLAHKAVLKAARKGDLEAQKLYFYISIELVMVLGEMDQYQAKVKLLREMAACTSDGDIFTAEMAWPLMKLGKEEAARQAIQKGLDSSEKEVQTTALNTLGALESYLGNHKAAYNASKKIIEITDDKDSSRITYYCNMGTGCLPLGRYEEAEKCFSNAAAVPFKDTTVSNPYAGLTGIYLSQARFSEAINSLQKTQQWSRAIRPFLYQQSMAGNIELKGIVYLELGLPAEAVNILRVLVQRPDRRGGNSLHIDQTEAGNLLSWRTALQTNLQRNRERLAATDISTGIKTLVRYAWQRLTKGKSQYSTDSVYFKLVWDNLQMRRQIDQADKRIAALAANGQYIRTSMLPYNDQSVSTTEWFRPNLVGIWGTGLSQAAIDDISEHPPEGYSIHKPFIQVLQGEIFFLNGSYKRSAEQLRQALQKLPAQETLLRLRTETRLAMALLKCGREDEALPLLQHVISSDGAMLREVGARLPIQAQIETTLQGKDFNADLLKGLKRSPRFKVGNAGIRLLVTSEDKDNLRVSFNDASGNSLKFFHISLRKPQTPLPEAALAGIHDVLCAPDINRSGLDDSLDGSNTSTSIRELIQYR